LLWEKILALKARGAAVLVTGHSASALSSAADTVYHLRGGALSCGTGLNELSKGMAAAPCENKIAPLLERALLRAENISAESELHETILPASRLEIRAGETIGITGENGSKSSLAKMLAGWFEPRSGYIEFDGNKADCAILRRHVRLLGQNPYAGLLCATAAENLAQAQKRALKPGFDSARAAKILEADGFLGSDVNRLSFGQAQRIAFLCALAYNPSVLILDEVTASLDCGGISQLGRLLREFADDGGAAVIISHLQNHLEPLCGRMVSISEIYAKS
jgi:energy-coupling factor transport system ATP-binding protein